MTASGRSPTDPSLSSDADATLMPTVAPDAGTADGGAAPVSVPGYDILAEVGRGGMGVVYRARHLALNRDVALKMVLAGSHAGPVQLVRFRQEAEAVARLGHPNIVQVHEVGAHQGNSYLALEYVAGGTLAQKTAGVPQPPRDAAGLVETLARAVHHAHERGVVHRDLKPANVLLSADGVPKVADFGLARWVEADSGLTATHAVLGTPGFIAPEQAEGRKDVGPAADGYALGAILYVLLTGRPPHQGETPAEALRRAVTDEVVPVRRLRPDCPRDLETVCLKCLQKDPRQRYATAAALADDLHRFLADEPVQARPVGRLGRLARWCRRHPAVAALTGLAATLLAVIAVGGAGLSLRLSAALGESERDRHQAEQERDAARRAERKRKDQLWRAQLSEARAQTLSGLPGQRFASLARLREALAVARTFALTEEDRLGLRNAAVAALALPDLEVARAWAGSPPDVQVGPAIDVRFERYARVDRRGAVSVRRVADDRELFHIPGHGRSATVSLSGDGRLLVVCDDGQPVATRRGRVWRLDGPEPVRVYETDMEFGLNAWFTPDGRRLVFPNGSTLRADDLETGRTQSWPLPGRHQGLSGLHPGGRLAAVACAVGGTGVLHVRDVVTGEVKADLPIPAIIDSAAWHPGGRVVAVSAARRITLWDVPTGQQLGTLDGHRNDGVTLAFNRAGDRLLSNDWSHLLRVWDWRAGRPVLAFPAGWSMLTRWFDADDRRVFCPSRTGGDGQLWLLDFAPGRERRTLARSRPAGDLALADRGGQFLILTGGVGSLNRPAGVDSRTGAGLGEASVSSVQVFRQEASGALLTHGAGGLLRWPRSEDPASGMVRFGPPQSVWPAPTGDKHGASADGRVIAVPRYSAGALILHCDRAALPVNAGPQDDVRTCAVSPDGRFVASGSHNCPSGIGAKVWDSRSGALVHEFRVGGLCDVGFSPDGRWLLTTGGGLRLWHVGGWDEGPPVPGRDDMSGWAFSPDGRLLAIGGHGLVRLVRTDDGRELAQLPFREQTKFSPQCFSTDGGELYVAGLDTGELLAWDLRLLRQGLASLDLDWDAPPLPADRRGGPGNAPGRVEFVGGPAFDPRKLNEHERAAAVLAAWADPFDPDAHARLGALSLAGGRPAAAVPHLDFALALQPGRLDARRDRVAAAFRLGRWEQAAADAGRVLEQLPGQTDCLTLRVRAYQRLGRHVEAIADLSTLIDREPREPKWRDLRADSWEALGRKAAAADDRRRAFALDPNNPARQNKQAWALLTAPPDQRDPARALQLARRAVESVPSNPNYLNTLGVALYRNGRFREAVPVLEKSLAAGGGLNDGFNLYALALCHARLGAPDRAKDCFDRAGRWEAGRKALSAQHAAELRVFRAEAEAVLGPRGRPGPGTP